MGQKVRVAGRPARWALWGAGVFALVGVVGFLVAPPLVRSVAQSTLSDLLHRPVSIEGVSINPYALSAEVRGFRMQERDSDATAASFTSLYVNVELESLFRGGVVVEELKLVEPVVSVIRLEGRRFNWSDVIDEILSKPDDGSSSHFAVHNIRVEKGRIDFDDKPEDSKHALTELELGLPFVSNMPSHVSTFVEPLLAMKVDDAPFEVHGKALPFSPNRESLVNLRIDRFDLTRYVDYIPVEKTFRLPGARFSSDLELRFAQPPNAAPDLSVKGTLGLDDVEIQHADGRPAIKLAAVRVGIDKLAPLAGELALGTVSIDKPDLSVSRGRDGQLSLLALIPKRPPLPSDKQAAPAAPSSNTKPFALSLAEFKLTGGRVHIIDELPASPYQKTLQDLHVSLRQLRLPGSEPAALDFGFGTGSGETFEHKGSLAVEPLKASGTLVAAGVDVPALTPYLEAALKQAEVLSGKVDARVAYDVSLIGGEPRIGLKAESLKLSDLSVRLKGEKQPLARLGLLELRDAEVDAAGHKVTVGEVVGNATRIGLVRGKDGLFNAQRLAGETPVGSRAAPAKTVASVPAGGGATAKDWQVEVKRVALDDWGVRLEDQTLAPAVVLKVEPLSLKVEGLSTAKGSKARLNLQTSVNKRGHVGVVGTLGLAPLAGSLDLDLKTVDLAMLQPYVTEKVKIAITRGNVTSRGRLAFELPAAGGGVKGGFKGALTVGNFASVDKLNATDFLKWKSLYFGGMDIRLSPLAVSIDEIALSDFYTRLILDAQGGLNIREITAQQATENKEAREAATPAQPLPPILIKRITLQGGNIAYSDRFIRPNYDANLTGMGGQLTGLSSDPGTIAELDLRGRVDNAAPVEVVGRLNPFRQDKALDIHASVKDFELSGVSTYAAKYVGYGIEKGKLSADLKYKVEDRKLTATNEIFLDQLTFGEQVDSPSALKLPVLLAVSLLKNSRGEIDLKLPVGGSLDDPEFSVAGLVVKVIVNLIGKAITSPFALLGSMFGGDSEELAWLDFDPGFARVPEAEEAKLKAISRAMNDKPGLKLDIAGRVDTLNDPEGLKRALLLGKVEALKVKDMARKGESVEEGGRVSVSPAEYPALLGRVYAGEKFPKPRNMIGMAKDLPVPEMEKLILASIQVGDDELRLLAQQRAQAVKTWLLEQGKVPAERVFLLASRSGDDGKHPKARVSRVDFSLR
ncbi:DUF748 domain-containing protein [Zoogloea sp.]|uniref:DUF748 domain-containing protein n=1 Tax=Zoogloea sp. TaxID=49181 RepID=UPI0037DA0300